MNVRPVATADAEAVSRLCDQLGYPASSLDVASRLERYSRQPEMHGVFVATLEGRGVVGWIHVGVRDVIESDRRAEVLGLVVDRDTRSAGVGRALVAAAEAWAKDHDVEGMVIRSNVARAESHPFYLRLGYGRTKTQHVYWKRLDRDR